jgi:AcrR family transcriptional regulator
MVAAAARALAEHGYADITVAQITAYARVSRSTFYENFKNRQDCVLNAHQEIFERFIACLSEACAGEAEWTDRVTASIGVGLAYMAANPDEACMLTLDSRTADTLLARRVAASRDHLASLLRACRDALPPATPSPQDTELALIGAISAVVSDRLIQGNADGLEQLVPELVYLTMVPYVGTEEAERIAAGRPRAL